MSRLRRVLAVVALVLAGVALPVTVTSASAHPLHTSVTDMTYDARSRSVRLSMRLFADDFLGTVARRAGGGAGAPPEAAMLAYVAEVLAIADAKGARIALRSCGVRREGDLVWLCLQGPAPRGMAGGSVRNRVLVDAFPDQINIVRFTTGGRTQSLLFTKDTPARRLP